ncbi:MAG: S41 family peptidase [Prolixibacteraceae bacterium]|nr:S41 family peptidase [Prolixibacteraceae bacterium]
MRNKKIKKISFIAALIVAVTIIISGFTRDQKLFQLNKNLDIYYSVIRELNSFYVDGIKPEKLIKTSIDDMLSTLDPYTTYIPESEMDNFKFMTDGEYAGIGAIIGKHDNNIIISEPYEGLPAQKAGLKAGDILKKIDGKSTENMTTEQVSNYLKGKPDEIVQIKIQRPGNKKPLNFKITREKVQLNPVPYEGMLKNNTGYIYLSNFWKGCGDEVKNIVIDLKKQGAKRLILDLRSNPGGLLNEAVKIVNIFVPKGSEVVNTRGKMKQWNSDYKATENPIDTIMPLAVLVNRGSASASEIVSGSLQDQDRAVIIGSRTFGKGLVQTTRDLGYESKLKVTTAKYYIPSGRCIQALDYTHRNEDGSVGNIPDSLISEFKTGKGRIVYDGGGIIPDIKMESLTMSTLGINLDQKFMCFDFATQYAISHKSIPSPDDFEITDEIYNEFRNFLKQKNFSYKTVSEDVLEKMVEIAKKEKRYNNAKNEFSRLKEKITPNLDKDLNENKNEIKKLLTNEIVSRYYYQKGAIKATLKKDKTVDKALNILSNTDTLSSVFASGTIIKMKKEIN